jgi:hypothetical protein
MITKFKIIGWICIGLLIWQGVASLGNVLAQDPGPTPRPTPGSGGGGGDHGGGDSSKASPPLAPKTGLEGFVYNYSSGANQPGITVVVKGDGWQGEATTDSNGYYQIVELGFGNAVANLQLPANGPKAAAANWPVQLVEANERRQLNLGLYWGDSPAGAIPVLLSGTLNGNQLALQVENRTAEAATGGVVEIVTPPNLRIKPAITASAGQIGYAAHRAKISLPNIAPGETVTIGMELAPSGEATAGEAVAQSAQVFFTYSQQMTPQAIEFEVSPLLEATEAMAPPPEINASAESQPQPEILPTSATASATGGAAAASPVTADSSAFVPAPVDTQPDAPTPTEKIAPLPETGADGNAVNMAIWVLAILMALGLAFSGWQSFKRGTRP